MAKLSSPSYAIRPAAIAFIVLNAAPVLAQEYSERIRTLPIDRGYQTLVHAKIFNFGGIGFGAVITPEEKAFRKLLESHSPAAMFRRLLAEANPEGQLYALYGLYLEDRTAFEKEAAKLKLADGPAARYEGLIPVEKDKVRVGSGCVTSQRLRRTVIDEIAAGKFDQQFYANDQRLRY